MRGSDGSAPAHRGGPATSRRSPTRPFLSSYKQRPLQGDVWLPRVGGCVRDSIDFVEPGQGSRALAVAHCDTPRAASRSVPPHEPVRTSRRTQRRRGRPTAPDARPQRDRGPRGRAARSQRHRPRSRWSGDRQVAAHRRVGADAQAGVAAASGRQHRPRRWRRHAAGVRQHTGRLGPWCGRGARHRPRHPRRPHWRVSCQHRDRADTVAAPAATLGAGVRCGRRRGQHCARGLVRAATRRVDAGVLSAIALDMAMLPEARRGQHILGIAAVAAAVCLGAALGLRGRGPGR